MDKLSWKYIMDEQPIHGKMIVQCDRAYEDGHHCMGQRKYDQNCNFQDVLDFCDENFIGRPDFWWIYAKDYPFPDKKEGE